MVVDERWRPSAECDGVTWSPGRETAMVWVWLRGHETRDGVGVAARLRNRDGVGVAARLRNRDGVGVAAR